MNNHFNLRRFRLLFRKHTTEHYKTYLMSLAVLLGGMFAIMGFINYLASSPLNPEVQRTFLILFLPGAGMVFSSTVFAQLGDKKRAIAYLTLPASQLEKYLVGWIYSFPVYLLLFVPSFYLMLWLLLHLDPRVVGEPVILNVFTDMPPLHELIILYALFNAAMLIGSAYFNKNHFIKTVFAGIVILIVFYNLNKQMVQAMLGRDLMSAGPFSTAAFLEDDTRYQVSAFEGNEHLILALVLVLALMGWAVAYFKVREKQV